MYLFILLFHSRNKDGAGGVPASDAIMDTCYIDYYISSLPIYQLSAEEQTNCFRTRRQVELLHAVLWYIWCPAEVTPLFRCSVITLNLKFNFLHQQCDRILFTDEIRLRVTNDSEHQLL